MKNKTIIATTLILSMCGISFAANEVNPTATYEVCGDIDDCLDNKNSVRIKKEYDDFDDKHILHNFGEAVVLNKKGKSNNRSIKISGAWDSSISDEVALFFRCRVPTNFRFMESVDILIDGEKAKFDDFSRTSIDDDAKNMWAGQFFSLSYVKQMINGDNVRLRLRECSNEVGYFHDISGNEPTAKEFLQALVSEIEKIQAGAE